MARKRTVSRKRQTTPGFETAPFKTPDLPDYVVAELRYESPVAFTTSSFVAPAAAADDANSLNDVLRRCLPNRRPES
jgi:hypothetical protein